MVSDKKAISVNFDSKSISYLSKLKPRTISKFINKLVLDHLNNKPLPDIINVIRDLDSKRLSEADALEFCVKLKRHVEERPLVH